MDSKIEKLCAMAIPKYLYKRNFYKINSQFYVYSFEGTKYAIKI